MATSVGKIRDELERLHLSTLIDWVSYDEETGIYDLFSKTRENLDLGFTFLCMPALGVSKTGENALSEMVSPNVMPADSIVQISFVSLPAIAHRIAQWRSNFVNSRRPQVRLIGEFRYRMYKRAAEQGFFDEGLPFKPKDTFVLVSVRIPSSSKPTRSMRLEFNFSKADEKMPESEAELRRSVEQIKSSVEAQLQMAGLGPVSVDPSMLIAITRQLFGPELDLTPVTIHPNILLRDQIFDADDRMAETRKKDSLVIGRKWLAMGMSAHRYAPQTWLGMAINMVGDHFEESKVTHAPFVLTLLARIPDVEKARTHFRDRFNLILKQGESPAAYWVPAIKAKFKEYTAVEEEIRDKGANLVDMTLSVVAYGKDRRELASLEKKLSSMLEGVGVSVSREREILKHVFLNQIPMNSSKEMFEFVERHKRVFTRNVAHLAPIYGDWKGSSSPKMIYVSRRGQIAGLDIFESNSNYNFTITASSGQGKTFFALDLAMSYIAQGGLLTVFDVGGGFKNAILMNGGEYLHIAPGQKQCFNPITNAPLKPDGTINDDEDEKGLVVDMLSMMACGARNPTQEERAHLEMALDMATKNEGNDADVRTVRKMLQEMVDAYPICKQLEAALYPFTDGRYADFFCGKANVELLWEIGGVELQELSNKPDLRVVVLSMMLNQAINQMFSTDRDTPKILLVDESHELLGISAADTEAAAQALERVTRKARKYTGATGFITQGLMDWTASRSTRAIFDSSEWMFLLRQRSGVLEAAVEQKLISLDPFTTRWAETLKTRKGFYSEFLVRGDSLDVSQVLRYIADPYSYAVTTSDGRDTSRIQEIARQHGCPISVACAMFAIEKFGDRAKALGIHEVIEAWENAGKTTAQAA